MNKLIRYFKHLSATRWQVKRRLPRHSIIAIEAAIRDSEKAHMGELRFAVEAGLDWPELFKGVSARDRAIEVFSHLRIWDTEHNSGVLIYLLLADHKVEIVADRGINNQVIPSAWIAICREMENNFRAEKFESGILCGIKAITQLLQQYYPVNQHKRNEISNDPVIL